MALTEMQEGDLIVKKESNYTIEKLTDDFRHWVSKRLNGSVGSFVKEIGLGYELIFGVGYRDYTTVGKVKIEANGVARINVNPRFSDRLPLNEYKPFLR